MGNEKALEPLLDPKRYLLTESSAVGALIPVAEAGNIRAIEQLAAVANDPMKEPLWNFVIKGVEKPASAGNAAAIDAFAVISRSENKNLRPRALRALENAAFNNQARATEALRVLGYK